MKRSSGSGGALRLIPEPAAERVAAVLAAHPNATNREVAELAAVSVSTASKYRHAARQQTAQTAGSVRTPTEAEAKAL